MKALTRSWSLALVAGFLVVGGCANSEPGTTTPGTGGSSTSGSAGNTSTGSAGNGSAGTMGNGGSTSTGTAGSSATGTAGTSATGTAGTSATGTAGNSATGTAGASGASGTAGASGTTGTAGRGGTTGTAGSMAGRGGTTGTAGSMAGRGGTTGTAGRGGTTGTAGTGGGSSMTGMGGSMAAAPLDCGPNGYVVENHGPASNRVNYIILGDGFTTADNAAGGAFEKDIANSMVRRFSPNAFPYNRYRNFVNICGIKLVSTGAICGSSTLGCCGDDSSRLANCNMTSVNAAYNALPKTLTIDWRAVMLNGNSWWNSGGTTMLYSGGNTDAPGAALHEGGHGFHQLADEYGTCTGAGCGMNTNSTGTTGTVNPEVNSCGNPTTTDGKWDMWIGYNAIGATGLQSTFLNSRYVGTGQYRPSDNSMMNSLFCGRDQANCTANTAYNQVSREQMVMSVWKRIHPIDSTEPAAGAVTSPGVLKVNVIDSVVISVDWTVDGGTPMTNAGVTFDTSSLGAGSHTVSAKAYDNVGTDLVRYRSSTCPSSVTGSYCHRTAWKNSIQTVTWTFTK
jgi:IgA Peptidase M64